MAAQVSLFGASYPDCADELIGFRNDNRAIARDRRYFDWRYLERPCAKSPVIVWAEVGGERAGALTLFPHDYHVVDGEYPVGLLGDISVAKEFRGAGIAAAMFRYADELEAVRNLHGCLVLPNDDAAGPLGRTGWRDANSIERLAKVVDFSARVARLVGARYARTFAYPLNALIRALSYETWYRPGGYLATVVPQVDHRFDELWRTAHKHGKVIGLRNARYLRWRYETHPVNSYRILQVEKGGALRGYAMYRVLGDVCRVDDIFCEDWERDSVHVVGLLLAYLRAHEDVATISVMLNRGESDRAWRRFGFLRREDKQHVMVRNRSSPGDDWHFPAPGAWHLTAGDKDV